MSKSLTMSSKGISKDKSKGGSRNIIKQNLGKFKSIIEMGELLSDCQVDLIRDSEIDVVSGVKYGLLHKLDQLGPKLLRVHGASLDISPLVSLGSSIPSDPGIEATPDNFEIEE